MRHQLLLLYQHNALPAPWLSERALFRWRSIWHIYLCAADSSHTCVWYTDPLQGLSLPRGVAQPWQKVYSWASKGQARTPNQAASPSCFYWTCRAPVPLRANAAALVLLLCSGNKSTFTRWSIWSIRTSLNYSELKLQLPLKPYQP